MDRTLQSKAIIEILESCDVYIASGKKGIAEKVGEKLGVSLSNMGVKTEEAKILFKILEQRLFNDNADDDSDVCILYCSSEQDNDDCQE